MTDTTTTTMSPSELSRMPGDGDAVRVVAAHGIGTVHELYLDYGSVDPAVSNGRLIYCVFPDGGPVTALQRWARTDRQMTVWTLPPWNGGKDQAESMRIQAEASEYVLREALNEVAAESDLPTGWRTGAPDRLIGLECADCGYVATTIEEAAAHEAEFSSEGEDDHGGWDTIAIEATGRG